MLKIKITYWEARSQVTVLWLLLISWWMTCWSWCWYTFDLMHCCLVFVVVGSVKDALVASYTCRKERQQASDSQQWRMAWTSRRPGLSLCSRSGNDPAGRRETKTWPRLPMLTANQCEEESVDDYWGKALLLPLILLLQWWRLEERGAAKREGIRVVVGAAEGGRSWWALLAVSCWVTQWRTQHGVWLGSWLAAVEGTGSCWRGENLRGWVEIGKEPASGLLVVFFWFVFVEGYLAEKF